MYRERIQRWDRKHIASVRNIWAKYYGTALLQYPPYHATALLKNAGNIASVNGSPDNPRPSGMETLRFQAAFSPRYARYRRGSTKYLH